MRVNIVLGSNDRNWILWDMANYIRDYNDDMEIEISVHPIEGYDVYHVNNDEMFDYPGMPWHRALYTCHQFERDNKRRTFWAREPAIRQARRIGCVCKEYVEILKNQNINPEKIYYTPAGVDIDKFKPSDRVWKAGGKLAIGYVGRKYESGRKGEELLRQILLLCDPERIKLVFLGDKREDEVEFCKNIGVECEYYQRGRNIEYEDFPDIYKQFDCLLITSKEEGGPVPALEALACGIPVITTPVGITKDVYKEGNCVFYNMPMDGANAISAMIKFNDQNADEVEENLWKEKYLAAKDSIRKSILGLPYTWERWAQIHREIYEDIYEEIKDKILIEDYMAPEQMNHISNKYNQMAKDQIDVNHLENFLMIEDEIRNAQGILGTKNIFENKPAIIVGAGPSLDKDLDLLKKYQNNFVIVSCDAAFPILESNGVKPDVIFVADWTAKQAYNFREGGKKEGEHINVNEYNIVLPTIVNKKVLEEVNKSPDAHLFFYNVFDPGSKLMELIPRKVGRLGGIVAAVLSTGMAFQFAMGMGCSPNVFIGHDLSYSIQNSEIQGYSTHISSEKEDYQKKTKFKSDMILFPDINRNMTLTHLTFVSFYQWVQGFLKSQNVDVINSSEQGILHGEKIKQMSFKNVCEEFGKEDISTEKKNKLLGAWYYNTTEELMI